MVGIPNHGHEHAILGFDGKSDVHRWRVDNALADQSAGWSTILGKSEGQGAKGVEGRAGFGGMRFAVGEKFIELDGGADGCKRTGATADHRVGHGFSHRRGGRDFIFLNALQEALEVFDGDAAAGSAAGNSRKVGGAEAEFDHAGFHAWRHVGDASRVGGHGQSAGHGGFHFLRGRGVIFDSFLGRLVARFFHLIESEALGFLGTDFDLAEDCADGIAGADLGGEFFDRAGAGGGDGHDGFVGLHLDQVGVGLNRFTGF